MKTRGYNCFFYFLINKEDKNITLFWGCFLIGDMKPGGIRAYTAAVFYSDHSKTSKDSKKKKTQNGKVIAGRKDYENILYAIK